MKRRLIGILLTLVLILSGCSGRQTDNTDKTNENVTATSGNNVGDDNTAGNDNTENNDTAESNDTAVNSDNQIYSTSVEDILARLTLEQKAAQMVQGAVYNITNIDMKQNCYGSILSTYGENSLNASEWKNLILKYQNDAISSEADIPYIYGNDAVHGVNTCEGTVIFPHNIGIGAANDKELTYQMGLAVANEAKLTGMLWNFAPCLGGSTGSQVGTHL